MFSCSFAFTMYMFCEYTHPLSCLQASMFTASHATQKHAYLIDDFHYTGYTCVTIHS